MAFQIRPVTLEKNESGALYEVPLPVDSCDHFLRFSGDRNSESHHSEKGGLMQGALVQTVVGTCISDWKPGLGPVAGEYKFYSPATTGDTLRVQLRLAPGSTDRRPKIICLVTNQQLEIIVESSFNLGSLALFVRALKRALKQLQPVQ